MSLLIGRPMNASAHSSSEYLRRAHSNDVRLNPPLTHRAYAVLRGLRRALTEVAETHIRPDANGTIVDFGCGDSPYRPLLAPRFARYLGVDLPGNARADFELRKDGTADLEDAVADAVLSSQVLEHVSSPEAYLAEARRLLKPGGLLLLSTHGYWKYHPDPVDYWRWTGPGLVNLLNTAGFDVLETRGVLGLAPAGLQLAQDAIYGRTPKFLRPLLALACQQLIRHADRFHSAAERSRDACVFVMVARVAAKDAFLP